MRPETFGASHVILRTAVLLVLLLSAASTASTDALPRRAVLGAAVSDADGGARIDRVLPASPAERAALKPGDIVLSIADAPVAGSAAFVATVKAQRAATPLVFAIRRDGAPMTISVTLDPAPVEHDPAAQTLYESVAVDGSLRRTLVTLPVHAQGRLPAVLIIGGIGCYTVDNPSATDDGYLRLAHDLAHRGVAVMRLEKSGVGDSKGPPCIGVDLDHEMKSYAVALAALRRHAHVDADRVYLFGHSIGTLIAPRLAATGGAAGVIVAEGVGRNWIEYELANLRRQLELAGEAPAAVDAKLAQKEVCMHRLLIERTPESEIEKTEPFCKEHNAYPAAEAYMQQAAALNIAEPWIAFDKPVLVIYGTADFITAEDDHHRIAAIVNEHRPGLADLKLIAGMDHYLQAGGTEQQDFDMRVKQSKSGPYDADLSAAVLGWLCRRERCRAAE